VGKRHRRQRALDKRLARHLKLERPTFSRTTTKAEARRQAIEDAIRAEQRRGAKLEELVDGIAYGPGVMGAIGKAIHHAKMAAEERRRRRERELQELIDRARADWEAAGRPQPDILGPVSRRMREGIIEAQDHYVVALLGGTYG